VNNRLWRIDGWAQPDGRMPFGYAKSIDPGAHLRPDSPHIVAHPAQERPASANRSGERPRSANRTRDRTTDAVGAAVGAASGGAGSATSGELVHRVCRLRIELDEGGLDLAENLADGDAEDALAAADEVDDLIV
jgi:hypothetical protein